MKTHIEKIIHLKNFLKVKQCSVNNIICSLENPSRVLLHNIHNNWLKFIYAKTCQHFPVYLNKDNGSKNSHNNCTFGFIDNCLPNKINELSVEYNNEMCTVKSNSELKFGISIPQQDIMQYFIQWQRYRKYWWSSITTTPSLFSIQDIKYGDESGHANISANFDWGQWSVETIDIISSDMNATKSFQLCCSMSLEKSLLTLLLDGTTNTTREEYLRLHNRMAPYKISFALNYKDPTNLETLKELAMQIYYKLLSSKISTLLPKFSLPLELQLKENLIMGVTYTAIITDSTLSNGIFYLMNSSTMLKEQIHVADFVNYAAQLCEKNI